MEGGRHLSGHKKQHQDWASSAGICDQPEPATISQAVIQVSAATFGGTPESPEGLECDSGSTLIPALSAAPCEWLLWLFLAGAAQPAL